MKVTLDQAIATAVEKFEENFKIQKRVHDDAITASHMAPSRMEARYDSDKETMTVMAAAINGKIDETEKVSTNLLRR